MKCVSLSLSKVNCLQSHEHDHIYGTYFHAMSFRLYLFFCLKNINWKMKGKKLLGKRSATWQRPPKNHPSFFFFFFFFFFFLLLSSFLSFWLSFRVFPSSLSFVVSSSSFCLFFIFWLFQWNRSGWEEASLNSSSAALEIVFWSILISAAGCFRVLHPSIYASIHHQMDNSLHIQQDPIITVLGDPNFIGL